MEFRAEPGVFDTGLFWQGLEIKGVWGGQLVSLSEFLDRVRKCKTALERIRDLEQVPWSREQCIANDVLVTTEITRSEAAVKKDDRVPIAPGCVCLSFLDPARTCPVHLGNVKCHHNLLPHGERCPACKMVPM